MKRKKQNKPEKTYSIPWQLATLFFIGLFLPLTILLSMIPGSWFSVDGYEDLGVIEFEAVRREGRGKKPNVRHYVIYEALDGSGISLREQVTFSSDAQKAVDSKEHIRRHVYRAIDEPNFILRRFRNTGYQFFKEGREPQSREEFQRGLNRMRTIVRVGQGAGLCYSAVYVAVVLRKRAAGRRKEADSEGQN